VKPVMQTLFGGCDAPRELLGNCYPACVASILEIPLTEVPHVHQLHYGDTDAACDEMQRFLRSRGLITLTLTWGPWVNRFLHGYTCVIGGRSPRGEFDHAVVALITHDGWELQHDPFPGGHGIVGEPKNVDIIFPIAVVPSELKVAA
jgi:hypothetical protein